MASVTKENEENQADSSGEKGLTKPAKAESLAKADIEADDDVRALDSAKRTEPRPKGMFTIYKRGQGYWTRMGTLIAACIVLPMLAYTLYAQIPVSFFAQDVETQKVAQRVAIFTALGFLIISVGFSLRLMNKPKNVDFLIATDTEMKKVNWTSRKELIGSSKVVIIFMFSIALYLFVNDIVWGYLMYWINVLKTPPLG